LADVVCRAWKFSTKSVAAKSHDSFTAKFTERPLFVQSQSVSGSSPKRVRAQLYRYEFTSVADILKGVWWKRTLLGRYSPELKTSLPPPDEENEN